MKGSVLACDEIDISLVILIIAESDIYVKQKKTPQWQCAVKEGLRSLWTSIRHTTNEQSLKKRNQREKNVSPCQEVILKLADYFYNIAHDSCFVKQKNNPERITLLWVILRFVYMLLNQNPVWFNNNRIAYSDSFVKQKNDPPKRLISWMGLTVVIN